MTSNHLRRTGVIDALGEAVPPGRALLSHREVERLRALTTTLMREEADAGLRELARFRALPERRLDLDLAVPGRIVRDRVIVVTGGTGCIGSNLLAQLRELRPARLVSVSRRVTPTWSTVADVEYEGVDVRDARALETLFVRIRPDVVFHLAAQHNPALAEVEVARTYSTNVLGSANVFEVARRHGVTVVHASTGKAMRPYSPDVYAASKKLAEWSLHQAIGDGSLRAAAVRFTHVVDNSIIYKRLQNWVDTGTPIRLHDAETFFYLQSAQEAAQLLLCALTVASRSELPLAAIRDVGMPVSLLDLAIGAIAGRANHRPDRVVPIYFCGRELGYDNSIYPGLYDPLLAGDKSPLISAFEADEVRSTGVCDGIDLTFIRAGHDAGTKAMVERLCTAALEGADSTLLRTQAGECSWAVLASIASTLPTSTLRRQMRLVGQAGADSLSDQDQEIFDLITRELRRRENCGRPD